MRWSLYVHTHRVKFGYFEHSVAEFGQRPHPCCFPLYGVTHAKVLFLARLPYQRAKSLSLQCTSTLLIWTTSAMLRAAVSPLSCINATMAS